jgi:hypothetical protein
MKKITIVTLHDLLSLNHLKTLLGILKNHYDVSVITEDLNTLSEKEKTLFESINTQGVQIMSSFQEWSLFELIKLTPFLFQMKSDIYHFLISQHLSHKQWTTLLSFVYLIKSIPGTKISMTTCLNNLNFNATHSFKKNWRVNQLRRLISYEIPLFNEPLTNNPLNIDKTISQITDQYIIPFSFSDLSKEDLHFLFQLLNEFNFKIIINGWGNFSLFKQNKTRLQFRRFLDRLIIKSFDEEELTSQSENIILRSFNTLISHSHSPSPPSSEAKG